MGIMTFDNCGNIIENPYSNEIALYNEIVALRNRYEIMKANYETRLKADMVVMLTELHKEIMEMPTIDICPYAIDNCIDRIDVEILVNEKINALKAEKEE